MIPMRSNSEFFITLTEGIRLLSTPSRCIDRLAGFVQPTVKIIAKHTKGKVFMLWGGPEPADGGHLNLVRYFSFLFRLFSYAEGCYSLCAGKTLGPGGQNFVNSEKALYNRLLVPMYGCFLRKCFREYTISLYTGLSDLVKTGPEDCQAMALLDIAGDKALDLGTKEYEDAFVHHLKDPNIIGLASSSALPPTDTVTRTHQPRKSASKSSRLPTLNELLASKVATVAKSRLPEVSPPSPTSPTELQLDVGLTQFPLGRMVLSSDSHDAPPLKSQEPSPVPSLHSSPPISCAPLPVLASAAAYSYLPPMPGASSPPLPPSPPASVPHSLPDLTQASASPDLGATNPLAHSTKKLYTSISAGTVTISLSSHMHKSTQHGSRRSLCGSGEAMRHSDWSINHWQMRS